ncbi:phage distal tail protein, Rcc01695 family [Aliiroseovarius sp. S253]|uniref:phage distal tail protein, Rcc01695 family n=1 Tax=Aliiroseovarius sp. S253 TaxID=3415133 RepID=UPI003C7D815E
MSFHEIRFPANLSFGSVGGPERRTEVVTLANGFEERNTPWEHSRRRYDAGIGMRSLDDVELLIAFFEARRGQLHAFRWKDWSDFKSGLPSADPAFTDQIIGWGDGAKTEFQLIKTYRSGTDTYDRPIQKPVDGTVKLGLKGDPQIEGTQYSVDLTTGVVTFITAPEDGAEVTAGYEFDVPVRFDTDRVHTSVASFQAGEAPNVPVVEVRV